MTKTTDDVDYIEIDDFQAKGLASEIIADSGSSYIAQDPRQAIDPMALKNLFYTEDWVYIVCDRIASKISSQWLRVMREEIVNGKKIVKPAEGHGVQTLLESPNDEQDYHAFMYSLVVDDVLMGNEFIWRAKKTGQLILLPSEATNVDVDTVGGIKGYRVYYQQDVGRKAISFKPEEICHIRRPNPSSRIYGLSPFIPGKMPVLFNRFTAQYLNNFYQKGAQPGLILEVSEATNEEKAKRLLRSVENSYHGRTNQRRTMILPKGVTAQTMTHTLADQQLIDYIKSNRETIINLLQVPKHELGLAESGSLGSEEYKTAIKNFWAGQLRSVMRRIAGSLTKFFAKELGPGYFLEFDVSDVDVLQEDQAHKAVLAQQLLATHTLNEVRAKLYDLDPVANGFQVGPAPLYMPTAAAAPATSATPATDAAATADPTIAADAAANQVTSPQQALNGAQVASLMEIVARFSRGEITRDSALAIIRISFALSEADALAVLADTQVGEQPPVDNTTQPPAQPTDTPDEQQTLEQEVNTLELNATNIARFDLFAKSAGDWFGKTDAELRRSNEDTTTKVFKRVLDVFAGQAAAAARIIKGTEKADPELPSKKELRKRITESFAELGEQYLDGLSDELITHVNVGYDSTVVMSFNSQDEAKLQAVKERSEKNRRLLLEARGIAAFDLTTTTTTEAVMSVIEAAIENNLRIVDIAKQIQEVFDQYGSVSGRAMVIARTEVLTAASIGHAAAIKDAERVLGPMRKMWVNAGDKRVRGETNPDGLYQNSPFDHWKLQGEVVDSDKAFSNDLMYPRDPRGEKGDVIQCRCRVVAVSKEDAEAIGFGDLDKEHTEGE